MKQKGQDIIEFALLLPIFMMLLYGMMYASFFYGDYMTISGIVRNAAREAAVVAHYGDADNTTGEKPDNYAAIKNTYERVLSTTQMTTHLYAFKGLTIEDTDDSPTDGSPANSVRVTAHMELTDNVLLIRAMRNRGMNFILDGYDIDYYMYNEASGDSTT